MYRRFMNIKIAVLYYSDFQTRPLDCFDVASKSKESKENIVQN